MINEDEIEIIDDIGLYEEENDGEDSSDVTIEGMDPLPPRSKSLFEEMVIHDEDEREVEEMIQELNKGSFFDRFRLGYRFEADSVYFFYENQLYLSIITESSVFWFVCIIPLVILEILAIVAFSMYSVWEYCLVIGGGLQVPVICIFLLYVLSIPFFNDGYLRLSEKAEKISNGEDVKVSMQYSCLSRKMNVNCLGVHFVAWIITFMETILFFTILFIGLVFCLTIILTPIGVIILLTLHSLTAVFDSIKFAFVRHHNYKGFLTILLSWKYFPFLFGMCLCVILKPQSVRLQVAKMGLLNCFVGYSTACSGGRLYSILYREENSDENNKKKEGEGSEDEIDKDQNSEENDITDSEDSKGDEESEESGEINADELPASLLESPTFEDNDSDDDDDEEEEEEEEGEVEEEEEEKEEEEKSSEGKDAEEEEEEKKESTEDKTEEEEEEDKEEEEENEGEEKSSVESKTDGEDG